MFSKKYEKDVKFVLIALAVVVLDQLTKWLVRVRVGEGSIPVLGDFLQLQVVHNTGVTFGLAQGHNLLFALLTLVIVIVLLVYYAKIHREKAIPSALTAVIVGGALGNLIDRLVFGQVIDFIAFSFWPTFNLADSAITLGVIGLVFYLFKYQKD